MGTRSAFLLGLLVATAAWAQDGALLTANGLKNPKAAEYQNATRLEIGGRYLPSPAFDGGDEGKTTVPFTEGALTDGITAYSSTKPPPYVYWSGKTVAGEVLFDLGKMCRIDRVRVNVLNRAPHGTAEIRVFVKGDPLEFPENLRVGGITEAQDGWNEVPVGRTADGLRLVLTRLQGRGYTTLSEVEIWGQPQAGAVAQPAAVDAESPKRVSDGRTWWAIDFGPKDSPSFGQFYVCGADAVYRKELGFGWIPYQHGEPLVESNYGPGSKSVPGLHERDRGEKKGAAGDTLFRDLVMTSAYYHSQVRQTFALDVPNGAYRVLSFHGDTQYGRAGKQNFWIEAEGQTVVKELVLPSTLTTSATYDVTVADGRLDLTFDARSDDPATAGFVVNGLVVLPAGTADEKTFAEQRIKLILGTIEREKREYFERTFREVPYVETATMVAATPADQQRGFIGWTPSWMTTLYPNSVPTAEDVKRPLTTFATPGEYEPVVVAIRALKDLQAVTLSVGELTGAGRLPAAVVDLRTVKCWPQRMGSSWGTEYRVMPELLEPARALDVARDTTQEWWLTIHVPDAAAPGEYAGPVTIKTADGQSWRTELRLRVLPFKLAEAEKQVGMYWYDTKAGPELLDAQVKDMVAHGMRAVTISRAPKITEENGKLVVDTTELLAFLRHLRELGLRGPVPYNNNFTSLIKRALPGGDVDAGYVQVTEALEKVSTDPTALKLLYYPVDEIGNDDARGKIANHLCGLVRKVPGATSYITVNNYAAGEKWGDTFDIWCGNIDYTPEQERKLFAAGHRYMRYGSSYVNDCRKSRNNCGLGFYRRGAEAMYFWHYQATVADPFNDFDGGARDWCAAYPGPNNTQIPTMDWESHREGVDDMRYIATLKQAIAAAEKGDAKRKQAAEQAKAVLQAVLTVDDSFTQTLYAEKLTHDQYHDLRWKLAEAILALR